MELSKEEYFITRLANCFGLKTKIQFDKFKKSFELEENKLNMDMMILQADSIDALFALLSSADTVTLKIECPDPEKFKKKGIVCIKLTSDALT